MRLLSSLRQTIGVLGGRNQFQNPALNPSWMGRSFSTRPNGCSEKCKSYSPNQPCCRKEDADVADDLLFNPAFAWHPANIFFRIPDEEERFRAIRQRTEMITSSQRPSGLQDSYSSKTTSQKIDDDSGTSQGGGWNSGVGSSGNNGGGGSDIDDSDD